MANTVNVNIRMDEKLKKQSEEILAEMGLNMTTAINVFFATGCAMWKNSF